MYIFMYSLHKCYIYDLIKIHNIQTLLKIVIAFLASAMKTTTRIHPNNRHLMSCIQMFLVLHVDNNVSVEFISCLVCNFCCISSISSFMSFLPNTKRTCCIQVSTNLTEDLIASQDMMEGTSCGLS